MNPLCEKHFHMQILFYNILLQIFYDIAKNTHICCLAHSNFLIGLAKLGSGIADTDLTGFYKASTPVF